MSNDRVRTRAVAALKRKSPWRTSISRGIESLETRLALSSVSLLPSIAPALPATEYHTPVFVDTAVIDRHDAAVDKSFGVFGSDLPESRSNSSMNEPHASNFSSMGDRANPMFGAPSGFAGANYSDMQMPYRNGFAAEPSSSMLIIASTPYGFQVYVISLGSNYGNSFAESSAFNQPYRQPESFVPQFVGSKIDTTKPDGYPAVDNLAGSRQLGAIETESNRSAATTGASHSAVNTNSVLLIAAFHSANLPANIAGTAYVLPGSEFATASGYSSHADLAEAVNFDLNTEFKWSGFAVDPAGGQAPQSHHLGAGNSVLDTQAANAKSISSGTDRFEIAAGENDPANWLDSRAAMAEMPLNFNVIDRAVKNVLRDVHRLGAQLTAWVDGNQIVSIAVATAAAVSGMGTVYYLRRRRGTAVGLHDEETSSNWLFMRLHTTLSN